MIAYPWVLFVFASRQVNRGPKDQNEPFCLLLRPKFSDSTKLNLAESVKMLAEAQDATGNVMEYFYFRLKPFLRIFTASRKPHLPTVITRSIGLKFL